MRKYTEEEWNKIANELCNKNNLIKLENCTGYHGKFKAMTREGYFVYPSVHNLKRNRYPLIYYKNNPDTIYNIELWIVLNNKNIELKSREYKDSKNNLIWICKNSKCKNYNKEFIKSWHTIQQNHICSECGIDKGRKTKQIPQGNNNLLNIYPELCNKYWDYKRNNKTPDQYYPKSNQKVYWKCNECNYCLPNKLYINNVVKCGLSCPRCSDGISYPEKLMFNILLQLNVEFKKEKLFNWSKNIKHNNKKLCGNKIYDFWIESKNCIIEMHGNHHYKQSKWKNKKAKTLIEEQENDKLKENLAKVNNIKYYVAINCNKSDLEYIKNNILKSKLNKIFNLNEINWQEAHKKSCGSKIKEVCDLWNNNTKNLSEMRKLTGLGNWAIIDYLKKGNEIGWCQYIPGEERNKLTSQLGKKNGKPIVQLTKEGKFINEYESISEASRILNIDISNISKVCNKKRNLTKNFIFMFKKDYLFKKH